MESNPRVNAVLAVLLTIALAVAVVPAALTLIARWRMVGWSEASLIVPGLLAFVATVLLVAITAWYAWRTHAMTSTMSQQTAGNFLLTLHKLYDNPRTYHAIRFIFQVREELWQDFPENRYKFGQKYLLKYLSSPEHDLHRWHLVNFWHTLATAVQQQIITTQAVRTRFGSSEVIEVLEPIQTVLSYQLSQQGMEQKVTDCWTRPWAPLALIDMWTEIGTGRVQQSQTLPAFPEEFREWIQASGDNDPDRLSGSNEGQGAEGF